MNSVWLSTSSSAQSFLYLWESVFVATSYRGIANFFFKRRLPRYPGFTPMDYDSFDGILHYIFRSVSILFASVVVVCWASPTDPRQHLVQALRGEHRGGRMPTDRKWGFQIVSLRKSLFGTVRGCHSSAQSPCRCKSSISRCPFCSLHRVSTSAPASVLW